MKSNTKKAAAAKRRLHKFSGGVLIGAAAAMLVAAGWLTYSYVQATTLMQRQKEAALNAPQKIALPAQTVSIKPDTVSGTPVKIEIPSVGITQPVARGEYDAGSGEWTLDYRSVFWGTMTPPVNSQTGNTFIYGHDVPEIFGNLLDAKVGDKAVVTTDNGYMFTYTLRESVAVDPTDTSKLQPTSTPTLTVQTCSGSWYQYRQMFTFSLDGYKKTSA